MALVDLVGYIPEYTPWAHDRVLRWNVYSIHKSDVTLQRSQKKMFFFSVFLCLHKLFMLLGC